MSRAPLTEALRCVNHIAGRLKPTDEVAVVLYDDQVQRPLPLRRATNASAIEAALTGVESGGSTTSSENIAFCADETDRYDVPAFQWRKSSEGAGRKG